MLDSRIVSSSSKVSETNKITLPFKTSTIENELIQLAIGILNKKRANDITEIREFIKQNKLNNAKVKDVLINKGLLSVGDVESIANKMLMDELTMSVATAEKKLKPTKIGTWLIRCCPNNNYYITQKKGDKDYSHVRYEEKEAKDIEAVINGYSMRYLAQDMLLNFNSPNNFHFNYTNYPDGKMQKILKTAPPGAWLLNTDKLKNTHYITLKLQNEEVVKCDLGAELKARNVFSLSEYLSLIEMQMNLKLQPYGKGSITQQTETTINYLFNKKVKTEEEKSEFEKNGFIKLSRTKQKLYIDSSYIIKNLSKNQGENGQAESKKVPDIKIYQWIHGKEGFLGQGPIKTVKQLKTETGEKLVRSKFKNIDAPSLKVQYPELESIINDLKNEPHVAADLLVEFENKKGIKIPCIMGDFADQDLLKLINAGINGYDFPIEMKLDFAKQLLLGLEAMHKKGIAHRDLKPENINVYKDPVSNKVTLKLADLDFAIKKGTTEKYGTITYVAPELYYAQNFKTIKELQSGDIFSMGLVLYYLFKGCHLWFSESDSEDEKVAHFNAFMGRNASQFEHWFAADSSSFDQLMLGMIHVDPAKRLNATEVLKRLETWV